MITFLSDVPTSWAIPKSLYVLHKSKYDFFLGGSRRMSCKDPNTVSVNPSTDYDLYATFSPTIENFLISAGFECKSGGQYDGYYLDDEAVSIFTHDTDNVQVVLRQDAEFYMNVFEQIDPRMYYSCLWKQNPQVDRSNIRPTFNELFALSHSSQY